MSQGRRTIDRRRRVLYTAQADSGPSTAASRREAARLRQARRPTSNYGSRVHQQLRGRWFGLVPVRRRTMSAVVGSLAAITIMLCAAHYIAVTWPSIANRGDIARPLRLDRPDSFGRWFIGMLMIGSAGASFLIYQLRRHRSDDFRGHYRLWRLVLIVMLLASLNSVVSLIDWSGALLEAGLGKRVALSGADWIRIVVSVSGAILMLRLIAEVRRSRAALVAMLAAAGFLVLPEAVKWNVLEVETIGRWALITSAPLLAFTSLFISFGIYLRMLYREVRRLNETDSLKDRFEQMRLRVFKRPGDQAESNEQSPDNHSPRRSWWRRARSKSLSDNESRSDQSPDQELDDQDPQPKPSAEQAGPEPQKSKTKKPRRWFGLRRAKSEPSEQDSTRRKTQADSSADSPTDNKPRRSRFSLRLKPPAAKQVEAVDEKQLESGEAEQATPKRRFGLAGFRRQKAAQSAGSEESTAAKRSGSNAINGSAAASGNDHIDPEEIDWNGLNKSERRRLRKQLKRQNNAA